MDATWLPGIVAVGALAFIWWDIRRGRNMTDNKLKSSENKFKKALYNDDGVTVYIPRSECKNNQETFCKKTEEIKKLVADLDKKIGQGQKEESAKWEGIQHTLGKIDQYMETHI